MVSGSGSGRSALSLMLAEWEWDHGRTWWAFDLVSHSVCFKAGDSARH